ncbi:MULTISPECIES: biopolymer transporter ExbD [Roseivirga]|jgi:biopolymer transport protein ExbD|uniref:Biopolymer transporter ExbD n=1 Tax=Roseivirga thermotolerans TaxID=1758176 RepID=A0ABQ3I5Y4_9BACT|nr:MULTISPECIES: biopolymer transporter ExbD [Roseivirga]MEC7752529.1 biopolymer transporter ExbD [Bacteroidota bacterium]GHE67321.1 biopolymer transporter ExbD [Roseivirga thermotolerans]|tara:strand:+ start:1140 stop:1601 length:462 start_codon:yes stop_codon:yes gene_type:complete
MSKFKKKSTSSQDIPTAALPDIIFMLLFFFMVTTVLRETEIKVEQRIPRAEQLVKLEKKKLVTYLYVGKPKDKSLGTEPLIQANDAFIGIENIVQWINEEKSKLAENERDQITVSMKVDNETKMGIIVDIQTELREANARKIMYATPQKTEDN